jgi:GT2 family glycosyltransferase
MSPESTCEVDIVKGCAIAMRREVFDAIGGWDESYFLYAEERELCKATVGAGYRNYFVRAARIVHFGGRSVKQEDYAGQQIIQQQSALAYLKRHHGRFLVSANRVMGLLGFGTRAVFLSLLGGIIGRPAVSIRGHAARHIFRWFLLDYRCPDRRPRGTIDDTGA